MDNQTRLSRLWKTNWKSIAGRFLTLIKMTMKQTNKMLNWSSISHIDHCLMVDFIDTFSFSLLKTLNEWMNENDYFLFRLRWEYVLFVSLWRGLSSNESLHYFHLVRCCHWHRSSSFSFPFTSNVIVRDPFVDGDWTMCLN